MCLGFTVHENWNFSLRYCSCYSYPRYFSGQISRFRPPQTLRPVSFSSSPFPLPNPTNLDIYGDRNHPESGKVWATATRLFKILGFSISGKIGPHHLVDLEAHLTTNPTPPTLGKTTTGRRRIGELFPARAAGFRGISRPLPAIFEPCSSYES